MSLEELTANKNYYYKALIRYYETDYDLAVADKFLIRKVVNNYVDNFYKKHGKRVPGWSTFSHDMSMMLERYGLVNHALNRKLQLGIRTLEWDRRNNGDCISLDKVEYLLD